MKKYISIILLFFIVSCDNYVGRHISNQHWVTDHSRQKTVYAENAGVSSIHPIASKVGVYILKKGGNAIDAAIAMQLALAVVHPTAGNLGGGGFMTARLNDGTTMALDYREKAPELARCDMFFQSTTNKNDSRQKAHLSSGVPGTVAGIFESLRYAKLSVRELFQPAIELAENGYSYQTDRTKTRADINTAPNVYDGSKQWKEGDTIKQPELAATLKRIRDRGVKEFYEGITAKLIVAEMQRGGGIISMKDLKNYKAIWRKPHTFSYRGYDFTTMPLPSGGGILLNQMLKMIEPYPISKYGFGSLSTINLLAEVERRAYKDRAEYLGDPDFSEIPVSLITSDQYIKNLMKDYVPGRAGVSKKLDMISVVNESTETTHLSVVDKEGNAVAVTTTLNGPYGSGVVVGGAGFFLNNEMFDFYTRPGGGNYTGGGGAANKIEPGKRMLSSMTPTIISKDNKVFMVVGTPGGTNIPVSVFQAIVNVIDFKMTATDAVTKPKFHHKWMPDELEGTFPHDTALMLKKMGYQLTGKRTVSFLETIKVVRPNLIEIASERGSAEGYK